MVPLRIALVALAVAGAAVGGQALRADHRCQRAQDQALRASAAAFTREAAQRCGDPRDEAWVIGVATLRGDRAAAIELARSMTRARPDDYLGWLGVYRLTGDRGALARAHALNPRGVPAS